MPDYRKYLDALKTTTLFQNIDDEALIALLEKMQPEIETLPANGKLELPDGKFKMCLGSRPQKPIEPRQFPYDMPKFGEPGMLMGEIPGLSHFTHYVIRDPDSKRPVGHPPMRGERPEQDLMVLDGEMLTKFYGEDVVEAQNTMLRNFLGILAQKVMDIRHELFYLRDGRDIYNEFRSKPELTIFSAGVAAKAAKRTAEIWNAMHPEMFARVRMGGSVDLLRSIIAGEKCDVVISAEDSIIESMLMPKYAKGYTVFAGNRMVAVGPGLTDENWKEKLLAPDATFGHHDPYGDPGGYRAVMALMLADKVEPGLGKKLMEHPGHMGMEKDAKPAGKPKYQLYYYTAALNMDGDIAELPPEMNLSDDSLNELYATAKFAVDEKNTVSGGTINHAIAIPTASENQELARSFVRLFLETDFEAYHFVPRRKTVGDVEL